MERYLSIQIGKDLYKKIVLVTGPRQAGKTTLSRMLRNDYDYLNWDNVEHREKIRERSWIRDRGLIIFDEIHKMREWKGFLKGVYDVEGIPPSYLVIGSARLDTVRKVGDSLAGRYFQYRLHPLDVKEVKGFLSPEAALERLLGVGGFPEPFLENDPVFYRRWKRSHLDIILRQDLVDLEAFRDIQHIELLIELLRKSSGSTVSYSSLARDLQKDHKTIQRWLTLLENHYIIFPVRPWHRNIARAILKEPKYYFYDTGQLKEDEGSRLENTVACALKKELDFITDTTGYSTSLHFVKNKEGREVDFAVSIDNVISHFIEVKLSDSSLSRNFRMLPEEYERSRRIQLVKNLHDSKIFPSGEEVLPAAGWLASLDLFSDFNQMKRFTPTTSSPAPRRH